MIQRWASFGVYRKKGLESTNANSPRITVAELAGTPWAVGAGKYRGGAAHDGRIADAAGHVGDALTIDAFAHTINLGIDDAEIEKRRAAWKAPEARYTSGVLAKYATLVASASEGAVTDKYLDL